MLGIGGGLQFSSDFPREKQSARGSNQGFSTFGASFELNVPVGKLRVPCHLVKAACAVYPSPTPEHNLPPKQKVKKTTTYRRN